MKKQHNYLRVYRHLSPLSQQDIALLLGISDFTIISKYERSHRPPKIEILVLYHVLFNVPIEILLPHHVRSAKEMLINRIEDLKVLRADQSKDKRRAMRGEFLENVRNSILQERV